MHLDRSSTRRLGPLALAALCALALACGEDAPGATAAPVVSAGPASRAVAVGSDVVFDVGASGGALGYQWLRDGAAIAGATGATYTLRSAGLADDGARLSVRVSNALGAVTSPAAQLTVFPVPGPAASCTGGAAFTVHGLASAAGQAAGAALAGCAGSLPDVGWTQVEGPAVSPLALRSQAFGFEPPAAGTYRFAAAFTDAGGAPQTAEVAVTVAAAPASGLVTLRTSQSVREGGGASLRAWPSPAPGDSVQSVTWAQLEGPAVELDVADPLRAIFTAPAVAEDTLLRFRVTVTTLLGAAPLTDEALVLVEHAAQAPGDGNHVFDGMHVGRVHPYRAAGPWAAALAPCAYDPGLQHAGPGENLCPLSRLPFLDQETAGQVPTVEQVMDRVLVSHDWMGDVLQQLLEQEDPAGDLRRLFQGVTAIVVGAHVRPSFYYGLTGAIYLDADDFWLTPEERDVVDEVPDYRSGFDNGLSYGYAWRYAKDGQYVLRSFPVAQRPGRTLDYLQAGAGWLLFHELGHASDFMPPARRGSLDSAQSAWANIYAVYQDGELVSDQLEAAYPLTSVTMRGLARVKYAGASPSAAQQALGPLEVAAAFAPDVASAEYAYTSLREDLALLFEAFMMQHRLGAQYDIAFTDPITPTTTGSTLAVRWGERGRIGADGLRPRVQLVVGQIGPWVLAAEPGAVDALPAPLMMRAGQSWTSNLALPAPPAGPAARALSADEEPVWTGRELRRGPDLPLPRR